jgi:hypothetical protein
MSTVVVENPNPTFVVVKDSSAAGSVVVSKTNYSVELTNNQTVVVTQVVYNTPIEGQAGDTIVITNPPEFVVEVGAQGPQGAQGPAGPQGPAGAPGASSEDLEVVVRNNTGSTLLKGQVVYVTGALGQKPTVALASAAAETTSSKSFGFVKTDIPNNTEGIIVNFGFLHDVDTNAFEEGQALYLSTTPGQATNVKPSAPTHLVSLGWVVKKAGGAGSIFVQIQNGFELYELHNVSLVTSRDGQVLEYDGLTSLWKNKSPDKSPVFTYTSGLLTRVDYASGNYKLLTYTGSVLTQLVYVLPGRTVTKAFTYNLDGSLASISQSEVYN